MRTMFDDGVRREMIGRIRSLRPDSARRWGRMSAPQMIVHLTDQMSHTLGDHPVAPMKGPLRFPFVGHIVIYWLPWPKGRVKGPPEAFVTKPAEWKSDVDRLEKMLERLAARDPDGAWPEHAKFGKISGRDWGCFCYRHFDHHLRQFGA